MAFYFVLVKGIVTDLRKSASHNLYMPKNEKKKRVKTF